MRISGVNPTDVVNSITGITVSVWVQGCPHRCLGCHNETSWDFNSEESLDISDIENSFIDKIGELMDENSIKHNLSILGGEPLAPENEKFVFNLIKKIKVNKPDRDIYLWTGYSFKELIDKYRFNNEYFECLYMVDYLITDRFELDKRDLSLSLRGSSNQKIWKKCKKHNITFPNINGMIFYDATEEIEHKNKNIL